MFDKNYLYYYSNSRGIAMAKIKTAEEKLQELDSQLKVKKEKMDAEYKAYRQKIIDKKKELTAKKRLIATADKKRNRKKDTQLKIILGGIAMNYLDKNKKDQWFKEDVIKRLKSNSNKQNQLIGEFLKKLGG